MDIKGSVIFVTGGASGIGEALAYEAHARGAKAIIIADQNEDGAIEVSKETGGLGLRCDVSDELSIIEAVNTAVIKYGPIDIFFSNAGIGISDSPHWTAYGHKDYQWEKGLAVNLMSHVYCARTVVPHMIKRGKGAFIITASAAGLLTQIGDTVYTVSKYASVGFADSLAITHGDDGLQVGLICPEGVATPLTAGIKGGAQDKGGVKTAEEAAISILDGVTQGKYLITTHDNTIEYLKAKANDYDHWLGGMRKFRRNLLEENGGVPFIEERKEDDV